MLSAEDKETVDRVVREKRLIGATRKQLLGEVRKAGVSIGPTALGRYLDDAKPIAAREIHRRAIPYTGRIAAESPDSRWQADLAIYHGKTGGYKGFLFVMDVFTRRIYAEPVTTTSSAVVAEAFRKILARHDERRPPIGDKTTITTDGGVEFGGSFRAELEKRRITWRVRGRDSKNDLATLDRAMGRVKKELQLRKVEYGEDWPEALADVVKAYNELPQTAVHGAPDTVETNPTQEFLTMQDNAGKFAHNHKQNARRTAVLVKKGFFRVEQTLKERGGMTHRKRVFDATYGPVHEIDPLEPVRAGVVTDTRGDKFMVKRVLAVNA